MVFFEALQALLNFDLGFFIDLILGNIIIAFGFFAVTYFFFSGKRVLYWFILLSVLIWASLDFSALTGLTFTSATFMLVYYTTKLAVVLFTETTPALQKYTVLISSIQFYGLVLVFAFLVGGR